MLQSKCTLPATKEPLNGTGPTPTEKPIPDTIAGSISAYRWKATQHSSQTLRCGALIYVNIMKIWNSTSITKNGAT